MPQQSNAPKASPNTPAASPQLRAFRRVAIIVIIVSLTITAVIGIVTLVTGSYGNVQSRIMVTTLIIGATSVVALGDLAVLGRRMRAVGLAGLVAAAVALVTALLLVWGEDSSEFVVKTCALAAIAAASLTHAGLLLLLSERRRSMVRISLWITVALIAILLVLLYIPVLSNGDVWNDAYTKLVGTVAILDVLGTIVVPVVSLFVKDEGTQAALTVTVPAALALRLDHAARDAGTTAEQFVLDAIARSLGTADSVESAAS